MTFENHRLTDRKEISIPMQFFSSTGELETGETINVSQHGLFFIADCAPIVGEPIEMLLWPEELTGKEGGSIRCNGRVVHVQLNAEDGRVGIGVEIERFELDLASRGIN
jgi:hypothetical protein